MNCPKCKGSRFRRSQYRQRVDASLARLGIVAWRCEDCRHRFYARAVPLALLRYAHCERCGNFDLQKISNGPAGEASVGMARYLGASAYRCEPCRRTFASWRPLLRRGLGSEE